MKNDDWIPAEYVDPRSPRVRLNVGGQVWGVQHSETWTQSVKKYLYVYGSQRTLPRLPNLLPLRVFQNVLPKTLFICSKVTHLQLYDLCGTKYEKVREASSGYVKKISIST